VLKIFAPWAKGVQNSGEKGGCFVTGTMLFFFVMGQISMKFGKKTSIMCSKRRILKIFP